jgi:hypothetical protein
MQDVRHGADGPTATATLTREIVNLRPYAGDTDLDVLEQKQTALNEKIAQRDTLATNKKLYDDIDKYQLPGIAGLFGYRQYARRPRDDRINM